MLLLHTMRLGVHRLLVHEVPGEPPCSFLGQWDGSTIMLTQSYPHLPAGHTTEWLITPHFAESTTGGEPGGQLRVENLRGEVVKLQIQKAALDEQANSRREL